MSDGRGRSGGGLEGRVPQGLFSVDGKWRAESPFGKREAAEKRGTDNEMRERGRESNSCCCRARSRRLFHSKISAHGACILWTELREAASAARDRQLQEADSRNADSY